MFERMTPHITSLIKKGNTAMEAQYRDPGPCPEESASSFADIDPLGEESRYSPVKGIVHKFENRVLWKVSLRCAAHCRFCTRYRQIGDKEGDLSEAEIKQAISYIASHPEVDDVILSGGDPLYTPELTGRILEEISLIPSVRVIRIGTRLPVQSPISFRSRPLEALLSLIAEVRTKRALYVQIQINHPTELTAETREALAKLSGTGSILLSQTVFLRGINDDEETLRALFRELYYAGVVPYYIYRCDYVRGLERFVCDPDRERAIMTLLTKTMSGIAVPTYIIDVSGRGKIPVPLDFWSHGPLREVTDFDGKVIRI